MEEAAPLVERDNPHVEIQRFYFSWRRYFFVNFFQQPKFRLLCSPYNRSRCCCFFPLRISALSLSNFCPYAAFVRLIRQSAPSFCPYFMFVCVICQPAPSFRPYFVFILLIRQSAPSFFVFIHSSVHPSYQSAPSFQPSLAFVRLIRQSAPSFCP